MEVLYRSTRGNEESVSASKAILEGLASDGGLFVPQALPSFDKTLDEFAQRKSFVIASTRRTTVSSIRRRSPRWQK